MISHCLFACQKRILLIQTWVIPAFRLAMMKVMWSVIKEKNAFKSLCWDLNSFCENLPNFFFAIHLRGRNYCVLCFLSFCNRTILMKMYVVMKIRLLIYNLIATCPIQTRHLIPYCLIRASSYSFLNSHVLSRCNSHDVALSVTRQIHS